jgi:glycerophosphoryl diester phosphodiesterase
LYVKIDLFAYYALELSGFNMKEFQIIAHRGASGHAPENTIAAITKALEIGVDKIEIDVHQSSDGRIVVIHDETLNRTTNGNGSIHEQAYGELKKLDAGSWFAPEFSNERIPLLEEVLETVGSSAEVIIELKYGSQLYPNIVNNIYEIIKKFKQADTVLSSSRITILTALKTIAPAAKLAKIITPKELWRSLFQSNSFMYKQDLFKHITELHPHWSFIDKQFMEHAEKLKLEVFPWTVNKERKMRAMKDRGVHGVITNFPDVTKKIL